MGVVEEGPVAARSLVDARTTAYRASDGKNVQRMVQSQVNELGTMDRLQSRRLD